MTDFFAAKGRSANREGEEGVGVAEGPRIRRYPFRRDHRYV